MAGGRARHVAVYQYPQDRHSARLTASADPGENQAMNRERLARLKISGFRSLRNVTIELEPLTVLIGANGAGKSNLLWALEMVRMLAFGSLQLFVSERGGASFLMHYGPRETPAIDIELEFHGENRENAYYVRLGYGADESLVFLAERAGYRRLASQDWRWTDLGVGHRETRLREDPDPTSRTVLWWLRAINFYHFHDTSRRSPLRTRWQSDASVQYLRSDGSNLPAFLYALKISEDPADKAAWRRIEGSLQRVAPFVRELQPVQDRLGYSLQWVDERGANFGPAHLSDGTLRALALITALAQPESTMPLVSSIDELELGLHPAALDILCGLISGAAERRQVIVSTQSPVILDHVDASQVVVTERHDAATEFHRLDERALQGWLEDYSLSELYDKNVFGGRP